MTESETPELLHEDRLVGALLHRETGFFDEEVLYAETALLVEIVPLQREVRLLNCALKKKGKLLKLRTLKLKNKDLSGKAARTAAQI